MQKESSHLLDGDMHFYALHCVRKQKCRRHAFFRVPSFSATLPSLRPVRYSFYRVIHSEQIVFFFFILMEIVCGECKY